jgi:PAS domain S-box-containing protein
MVDVEMLNLGPRNEPPSAGGRSSRPRPPRRGIRNGELDLRIRQILLDHPRGLTAGEVASALSLGRSSSARRLAALAWKGEVDFSTYGRTRVFTLPRRAGLRSTLSRPSLLVLSLSPNLRVVDVNDPFLAAFRIRREDILGRPLGKTPFARCGGERLLAALREGTGGVANIAEFECLTGDSRQVFRARIMPLSPARGRRGVVVFLEDVTGVALHRGRLEGLMDEGTLGLLSSHPGLMEEILERKREEEEMQAIRSSVDQVSIPAFWVGRDGRFLRVNRAAALLLGYGEEELARLAFPDVDQDHSPGAWEPLWETLKDGSGASFESRFRVKDGGIIRVGVRASRISHRDYEFALLVVEDITRRREAEESLRASEATLRAFLDANPDPSYLVDTRGRVLAANRAGSDLIGIDTRRLIGASLFETLPGQAEAAREAFHGVLENCREGTFAGEISGRYFHAILSPLLNTDGEVGRVAIFVRDLTDRKRVEDSLRYANERLNLLTAVTRHDALNDITALSMYLAPPGRSDGLGPGSEMADKLLPLVQSLERKMEFTRDYADLGMKMPGWEDVTASVERAVAALDPDILRIDLDLPALEIYADPLFDRVIANLVDNTLRHGEHATCLRFRARVEGDSCTLIAEDDGVGVPPGMKEAIFRPGYGRHTGLGLFLAREILGITGMSISETGEPERGARFEIRIPRDGFRLKEGCGGAHDNARVQV